MWWLLVFKLVLGLHAFLVPIYCYLVWNFGYWRKRGLRTARPLTLFGTFPSLVTRKRNIVYDIHDVYLRYKRNNRAVGVFTTRRPEILVLDPQLATEVLVGKFRNYRDPLTSSWINNRQKDKYAARNPFWCAGDDWKKRRFDLLNGLTANKLKASFCLWQNSCHKLLQLLANQTDNASGKAIIETKNLINRYAADIMCDYIWGIDGCSLTRPHEPNEIITMTEKWLAYTYTTRNMSMLASLAPFVRKLVPFCLFPPETDAYFRKLTEEALRLRLEQPQHANRADFLNFLLEMEACKQATLDDMVGYALTVLLDGYETTGMVLMHTLFYLAKYPAIQKDVRNEIAKVRCQNGDGHISFETLKSLTYVDQCVYETMRLITPLPYMSRICTEATSMDIGPHQSLNISRGMVVTLPVFSYHRDEDYYPAPTEYRPARFDDDAHAELTRRGLFLPFSGGPRMCLGMRLALMTIKIALVEILSVYEVCNCSLTPDEQSPTCKTFVLGLEGDIMLEYKRLNLPSQDFGPDPYKTFTGSS